MRLAIGGARVLASLTVVVLSASCTTSTSTPLPLPDGGGLPAGDSGSPGVDAGGNPGTDAGPTLDSGGNPGVDSSTGHDSGPAGDSGGATCAGAVNVTQSGTSNVDPTTAQVIASGDAALVLWGGPNAGGYASLTGYFKVTGYNPNQSVKASIVMAPCSNSGCPDTFDFSFTGPNGDDLISQLPDGSAANCGSKVFMADAAGTLTPSVAVGGSPQANLGLWLQPQ